MSLFFVQFVKPTSSWLKFKVEARAHQGMVRLVIRRLIRRCGIAKDKGSCLRNLHLHHTRFLILALTALFVWTFFTVLLILAQPRKEAGLTHAHCVKHLNHLDEVDYVPDFSHAADAQRHIVLEVSHGLGNRLRSLFTAAALALQLNRRLIVVWVPDVHLNASLGDLFHLDGIEWYEESFLDCALRSPEYKVYDYLHKPKEESKRPKINAHNTEHWYIYTAYKIQSNIRQPDEFIKLVTDTLRPKPEVNDLMQKMKHQLWSEKKTSVFDAVGVHIRMQGDLSKDVPGVFDLDRHDPKAVTPRMSSVAHARGLCHWKYFLGVLERRRRTHRCEHVYVISSDSSEAQVELRAALGEGVYIPHLPEHSACTGSMFRSRLCIQLAFCGASAPIQDNIIGIFYFELVFRNGTSLG